MNYRLFPSRLVRMAMTFLALFCIFTGAWADDVTAEQALQQAQTFLTSHRGSAGGNRRAQSTTPKLTLASKVSGLYVFKVGTNEGFVIVSNDDRTKPILGFSDSGTIDVADMPSNMRAWLQGYADEIAWLQQHGGNKRAAVVNMPKAIGSHKTDDIGPLLETKWDQGAPYWNQTPYYKESEGSISYSVDYADGYSHCATGCVATAMAQVMKYHEWPKTATSAIPSYKWASMDETLPGLASVTFDWDNMQNTYSDNTTGAAADAVATLMKYCGYAVEMDYGPESGSHTDKVAEALTKYFDYNETTQYVTRSQYSYANWTDLIYHELENGRPVVYGGQSSGGGHEFVCDGYMYDSESETDFFHINWGWSGNSDHYFVLSALDPDIQGIGGSTSNDGFHFGQEAVIGIQSSEGTGTIADITPNTIDLQLNSVSLSKETITLGESVEITVRVKNNSSDPYDGDIMVYDENGIADEVFAQTVVIASGETKDCVFTITPTALGTYSFIPLRNDFYYFEDPIVNKATLTVTAAELPTGLTVYDGTDTSEKVPAYIYYFDDFTRSQFVIPADDLAEMEGGTISGISFYTTSSNSSYTTESTVDVYLKEVAYTSISDFETKEGSSIVYQGTLSIAGGGLMAIQFATPYKYNGGNLLIGIDNTTDAGWKQIAFYGQTVNGASFAGSHSTNPDNILGAQQNFIPKTTFDYTPGIDVCRRPTALALVGEPTYTSAQLTWTPGSEDQNAWQLCVNGDEDNLIDVTENPYTLTGLTQDTEYTVKIRGNRGGGNVSAWSNEVTFTTPVQYLKPTTLAASNVTSSSATISWTGSADSYNLRYRTAEETVVFSDGFESGLSQWTIIRNGEGTNSTDWRQFDPDDFAENPFSAHEGDYAAMSRSWSSSSYSVDNWLITPQVVLGGTMRFWVIDDGQYHEHYDVYVSTTTKEISSFTKVFEPGDASKVWTEVTVDLSAFAGKNGYVAIRHTDEDQDYLLIDDVTITTFTPTSEWTTVNDAATPYTLTGLVESTIYQVEVQGVYGDGASNWSTIGFSTSDSNPVPTDVEADLAADGATLTWTGNGDSYNVQYRTAASEETVFFEDFENGIPDTWTTIDADGDGNNWLAISNIGTTYPYYANGNFSDWVHTGNNAATSPSYYNTGNNAGTDLTSDHYLISPRLDLKGTLKFYTKSIYDELDSYEVCLSTTGKSVSDFTITLKAMAEATDTGWDEVSIDLSAYAGQQGYIAIHHVSEDCYFLVVDDFGLYGTSTPAGSWQDIAAVTETTATLSGLATNHAYEYRIQSVKGDNTSDWSEPGEFALLTLEDASANADLILAQRGKYASVTLANRILWRDGDWNTLVLPFDVDLTAEGCPLAGATARELSTATITGTTLTLNFSDPVDELWAGVPYIIKWDAAETNIVNPVFNGVTIDAHTYDYDNDEDDDERVRFIGTYDAVTFDDEDQSILFMGANNNLYYPDGKSAATINACRAYFKLGEDGGAALARAITAFNIGFGDDDEATGIVSLSAEELRGHGEGWYTLDGRKLSGKPMTKGVYIHDGKKKLVP